MRIVTTITDLDNIVDDWISEPLAATNEEHQSAVRKISREISDRAHKSGLTYGQDWDSFLGAISSEELCEIAEQ
jgi:hypothetical protein